MIPTPSAPPAPFGAPPQGSPPPKRSSASTVVLIIVAVVGVVIIGIGVLSTLAIVGFRRYIARAKQAEVHVTLATLAKGATAAFEGAGRICPSAASPVPASVSAIAGKKYQSAASEWSSDPGFACLGFAQAQPQYYQYDYRSTAGSFVAIARGDLDGDGDLSRFELEGRLVGHTLSVAPALKETNPEE